MINWGIIGCGDVTEVKSGPAFSKIPGSKLVAVMRRDAAKAQDYARRHYVARWYSSVDDILNDKEVNAIYVATPPLWHEKLAIAALESGRPVYLEKPMAINSNGAEKIVMTANRQGRKLTVAHYRREIALFKKVKQLIDEGVIGRVLNVQLKFHQPFDSNLFAGTEGNWRLNKELSGGGLFHDLAPHQLDLMLYFFGKPISAAGKANNESGLYDLPDVIDASIKFEHNVGFEGSWKFTAPLEDKQDTVEITGANGKLSFACFDHSRLILESNEQMEVLKFLPDLHVQEPMIRKVVQYFSGEIENPCSGEDGVTVMEMIDRITGNL